MQKDKNDKNLRVKAKFASKGDISHGRIVVTAEKFHKVIPAVLFTPKEAKALLEIVDKVESDFKASS